MNIERAIQIAGKEWGNIRVSLEKSGDSYFRDLRDFIEQLEPLWQGISNDPGFSSVYYNAGNQDFEDVVNWV